MFGLSASVAYTFLFIVEARMMATLIIPGKEIRVVILLFICIVTFTDPVSSSGTAAQK